MKKIVLSLFMLLTATFAVDCENGSQRVDDNIVIMGATCEHETLKTTFVIKDSNDMIFSKFTKDQNRRYKSGRDNRLVDKASWIYNYEDGKNFTVINLTREDCK